MNEILAGILRDVVVIKRGSQKYILLLLLLLLLLLVSIIITVTVVNERRLSWVHVVNYSFSDYFFPCADLLPTSTAYSRPVHSQKYTERWFSGKDDCTRRSNILLKLLLGCLSGLSHRSKQEQMFLLEYNLIITKPIHPIAHSFMKIINNAPNQHHDLKVVVSLDHQRYCLRFWCESWCKIRKASFRKSYNRVSRSTVCFFNLSFSNEI